MTLSTAFYRDDLQLNKEFKEVMINMLKNLKIFSMSELMKTISRKLEPVKKSQVKYRTKKCTKMKNLMYEHRTLEITENGSVNLKIEK